MANPRRTPCVGICSTTYGDLVCRGCKRFAHEIVQWNGYDQAQQELVWHRLYEIREAAVLHHLHVVDEAAFAATVENTGIDDTLSDAEQRYELLRTLVVQGAHLQGSGLAGRGLSAEASPQGDLPALESEALHLMRALDGEIYNRSLAYYEHCFRVPT